MKKSSKKLPALIKGKKPQAPVAEPDFIEMNEVDEGKGIVIGLGGGTAGHHSKQPDHGVDDVYEDPDGNMMLLGDSDGFAASFIGGKWMKGLHFAVSESFLMRPLPKAAAKAASMIARTMLGA